MTITSKALQQRGKAVKSRAVAHSGMPDPLKAGLEQLSGLDLSGVRVHYNSAKPAGVGALAYTQGQDIHVGTGQEQHLPHEGWHVVQQMEGRVKPTMQLRGVNINDDVGLEREADVMGRKALQMRRPASSTPVQRQLDEDQQAAISKLFANAYDTATFRRKEFSKEEREKAWLDQAVAEARATQESLDEVEHGNMLKEMGLTAEGIHLRHIIPYSDIAGLMRVATSDSTITQVGPDYAQGVRDKVGELITLVGSGETRGEWDSIKNDRNLLRNPSFRSLIQKIYHDLAHSEANLYHGSGSANLAIGNRPDPTDLAAGVHGREHIKKLMIWWVETMRLLGLNPRYNPRELFDVKKQQSVTLGLYEHDLSRPLKAIHGDADELRMLPPT